METFATFRVGRERLVGVTHLPDTPAPEHGHPLVVMLHGFTGDRSEEGRLFTLASRAFEARGLASLRFDFRGSGDSDGDHADVTVSREVEDAFAAVEFARGLPGVDGERVSLLGLSLGGMVAALAAQHARPHRLALWSPMLPQDMLRHLPFGILPPTLVEVKGLGVSRAFLAELSRLDPLEALRRAGRDTHVFHGEKDDTVPRASAEQYAFAANAPFSTVPRVGHAFEKIAAREALYGGTLDFLMGRL
ncbi:alpha/beta hydrolase [Deinococcus pimensis]|uniref:alpha/beta hydrolase n=1 Tax=Deinococcus pimensis TaxID=309888 RepID=UPI0004AEAEDF|nr:alpha/beta fold hydrolase [Deinococcus pimensis]